jgi:hypothetical protein
VKMTVNVSVVLSKVVATNEVMTQVFSAEVLCVGARPIYFSIIKY